jgi:hypothetical protein
MLPPELLTDIIDRIEPSDIIVFCKTNKNIYNICKNNKTYLVKQYLKKNDDLKGIDDLLFLFKDEEELYESISIPKLLDMLSEDYPINQTDVFLNRFGLHVSKKWKKYISISPEIVLLSVAHNLKNLSEQDLSSLVTKIPARLVEQIKEYEVDWFNTTNDLANKIYLKIKLQ